MPASFSTCATSVSAAAATAATVPAVCDEPPAIAPAGSVLSPYSNDTSSSVTPSRSAACCACTVAVPMPISWPAVDTVTRPSASSRSRAFTPGMR